MEGITYSGILGCDAVDGDSREDGDDVLRAHLGDVESAVDGAEEWQQMVESEKYLSSERKD